MAECCRIIECNDLPTLRILTDHGTGYCGRAKQHDYQLCLAVNDIDHTKIDFPPIFLYFSVYSTVFSSQKKALTALAIRALLI
jgi:hypothetical protein